jgi:hypothetical protein
MFDEYINNNLDKTSSDDFTKHLELCENCKKDFEIYKAYFSDINIENTYAFPQDLNANIKYKLNDIKKEKKYLFRPKIVLAYATSISFLLLFGIFGNTYINNLKPVLDSTKTGQIKIKEPTPTNKPVDKNKAVLEAPTVNQTPKATQVPVIKPKNETINNAIPTDTPVLPSTPAPSIGEQAIETPKAAETPAISTPIPSTATATTELIVPTLATEDKVEVSDNTKDAKLATIPTEQPEQGGASLAPSMMQRSMKVQKINVEISTAYKNELLQKYSYTEISTDLYNINTDIETLKKDFPNLTITNTEFEEGYIAVQFITN